jgi:hypothetical protein
MFAVCWPCADRGQENFTTSQQLVLEIVRLKPSRISEVDDFETGNPLRL